MSNIAPKRSRELFTSGYYCAESVLLAIAECKNIQSDLIPKIATGFCSGISRTCGMCGAVSGAIMAINIFYGRSLASESVDKNYSSVGKFLKMFKNKFDSFNCEQLLGCDLGTEKGQDFFESNNLLEQCTIFTEEATRMAIQIIEEEK